MAVLVHKTKAKELEKIKLIIKQTKWATNTEIAKQKTKKKTTTTKKQINIL